MENKYLILLLDGDNNIIHRESREDLLCAKCLARYMLSNDYNYISRNNIDYRLKVEIKDSSTGICVWDIFKNDAVSNR